MTDLERAGSDFMRRIHSCLLSLPGIGAIPYGIGCAWVGRNGLSEDRVIREAGLLESAYEQGFRYFDTSEAYGESEVVVGEFVRRVPRDTIFLATKSMVPAHLSPEAAAALVRSNLERSLQRLNVGVLDLFQVHDVDSLHQVLQKGGILEMLADAKRSGLIRNIGLATRNLELLKEGINHGGFDTVLTYSDYTPIDQSAAALIRFAGSRGAGVINGSPLSAGLLTGGNVDDWNDHGMPDLMKRKKRAGELFELCDRLGESLLGLTLHYPIGNKGIQITLTGPSNQDELSSTLDALRQAPSERLLKQYAEWADVHPMD